MRIRFCPQILVKCSGIGDFTGWVWNLPFKFTWLNIWSLIGAPPTPTPPQLWTLLWNFEKVGSTWRKQVGGGLLVLCLAYSRGPLIPAWTLLPVPPNVTNQPQMPATLDRKTPITMLSPLQWERAPPTSAPKFFCFTIVRSEVGSHRY